MKNSLPPFNLISHLISLDLTRSQLKVAVALALCRNAHSGRCCPAQTSLATTTALSRITVLRCLTKLRAKGVIQECRMKRTSTNHYFFMADLQELAAISLSNGNKYPELNYIIETIQNTLEVSL